MEEEDKAFARQDFLFENHLKEKSNPQMASNWLAYLGFEYGPFIQSYYTDGHMRSSKSTGCSMERNSLRMRSGSTNGCS
jgi:hypothetical protein